MRVTVGDSVLCCCVCVTSFEGKLTPLCVDLVSIHTHTHIYTYIYIYNGKVWNLSTLWFVRHSDRCLDLLFFADGDWAVKYEIAATDITVDGELCWRTLDYKQHYATYKNRRFSGNMHVPAFIQLAHQQHAPSMYELAHKSKEEETHMHLYYNNKDLFDFILTCTSLLLIGMNSFQQYYSRVASRH